LEFKSKVNLFVLETIRIWRIFAIREYFYEIIKRPNCSQQYYSARLNECEEGRFLIFKPFFTQREEGFFVHKI
jgi:hypothetical protein